MIGIIPVFKVNYTIRQLLSAALISKNSTKYSAELRKVISDYFNVKNVLLTSSARCALYMLFKYLPQKRVIVPAYTCEVVVEAAMLANKEIIFARVSKNTLNIKEYPEIDSDTIVIATHQYGLPCDIDDLVILCKEKNAIIIEDCAGSLGTTINGKLTGTFGDFAVFSFSASKLIQSPTKGGFILAKNEATLKNIGKTLQFEINGGRFKIKQFIKALAFCLNKDKVFCSLMNNIYNKSETQKQSSYNNDISYKSDFYEWQAYVVLQQFHNIKTIISERKKLIAYYNSKITNPLIVKPTYNPESVCIRYPVLVKNREKFINKCKEASIQVGTGYSKPIIPEDFYQEKEISAEIVYLPLGGGYKIKDIDHIISVVNSIM